MAIFTISYDLIKQKDYQSLWDALIKANAHRVLDSVWLLNANSTAKQVHDWLKSYLDNDDRIFVSEAASTSKIYYSNAKAGSNKWLESAKVYV